MKKIKLTEQDIRDFVNENIKGTSYDGMFRPYHFAAVCVNNDEEISDNTPLDSEIYYIIQPSSNSYTDYPGFKVFDNGDEGSYNFKEIGESNFAETKEYNGSETCPEDWGEMSYEEKVEWIDENDCEYFENDGENSWDTTIENQIVSWIVEKIEEQGFELSENE